MQRLPAYLAGFYLVTVLSSSAGLPARVPRGVFSLTGAGSNVRATVLTSPYVDGISIRQDWAELEPNEGSYNWSYLDSQVALAAAASKTVLLRINTQANKPAWVTNAVAQAGGTFITITDDGATTTIPVFWEPTFLAKKKAMIAALGAHFTHNSTVAIVCASFANASSEDWSVPHTPADVTLWLNAGYTSEKLISAGQQIIDATMTAFPNQFVTLAVGGNGHGGSSGNLDPDASYVARNAVLAANSAWPGRLIVQKNDLSTYNPPASGIGTLYELLWDSRPRVAGQMLDSCYGDESYRVNNGVADTPADILRRSVDLGMSYGMNYIEIYQNDVLNLPDEIASAHSELTAGSNAPKPPSGLIVLP